MTPVIVRGARKLPPPAAFFTPSGLSDEALLRLLVSVSENLVAKYSGLSWSTWPQRRNARSLIRRIQILLLFFQFLRECRKPIPILTVLCLKEFFIVVSRAEFLLDYCRQSGRLSLLLRNPMISGQFHDLGREISTLLDLLPLDELELFSDVREHVELLRRHVGNSLLHIDCREEEELRLHILSILKEFEEERLPESADLKNTFLHRIQIQNAGDLDSEIEFLVEQLYNLDEFNDEIESATIASTIAVARYSRFVIFGVNEAEEAGKRKQSLPELNFISVPKDFCCPISLEIMSDPVVISTGQTYEYSSIARWIAGGYRTCPNSGQSIKSTGFTPNSALHRLIFQWCTHMGFPCCDQRNTSRRAGPGATTKAVVIANRATSRILIRYLSAGDLNSKTAAAQELRKLAKIGKENREIIAEEGAIPVLCLLLHSRSPILQENAIFALLNLSIHDPNKRMIMNKDGSLSSIVAVLRHGLTPESREISAAVIFSLSVAYEHKKRVMEEPGGVEALVWMLSRGSERGKKDAMMALFSLSTHQESWGRMVSSGAVEALVGALGDEMVAGEAAGALALLLRRRTVAGWVGWEAKAVMGLDGVMRAGSTVGRENAAVALREIFRRGGRAAAAAAARVVRRTGKKGDGVAG
ncbi:U-box domain-containing protein 17 [Platanthera guangdongensis]|uniref:RING-type E3 ubiquitin transferase n=1 Tax=Platanthera guangdongensis TaxID=2320717 RepID=A0ABR2M2Q9_9ASPA